MRKQMRSERLSEVTEVYTKGCPVALDNQIWLSGNQNKNVFQTTNVNLLPA
jgi:hypothetical protein